jgi:hypothetical protein
MIRLSLSNLTCNISIKQLNFCFGYAWRMRKKCPKEKRCHVVSSFVGSSSKVSWAWYDAVFRTFYSIWTAMMGRTTFRPEVAACTKALLFIMSIPVGRVNISSVLCYAERSILYLGSKHTIRRSLEHNRHGCIQCARGGTMIHSITTAVHILPAGRNTLVVPQALYDMSYRIGMYILRRVAMH